MQIEITCTRRVKFSKTIEITEDRWMQPAESAGFRDRLLKNPDAKKFKRVYVVVNQPYIVSGCKKEQIRTITNNHLKLL